MDENNNPKNMQYHKLLSVEKPIEARHHHEARHARPYEEANKAKAAPTRRNRDDIAQFTELFSSIAPKTSNYSTGNSASAASESKAKLTSNPAVADSNSVTVSSKSPGSPRKG
jgi:hypothetical protein